MLEDPMLDPVGALITELRADLDVAALVGSRVRGGEPAPGDAKGPGDYQAFVVLTGAVAPDPRVPITRGSLGLRCYGSTFQNAAAVWGAVVKTLHMTRPRRKSSGLGIYMTGIAGEPEAVKDPDTGQPVVMGTLQVIATAQAIAE